MAYTYHRLPPVPPRGDAAVPESWSCPWHLRTRQYAVFFPWYSLSLVRVSAQPQSVPRHIFTVALFFMQAGACHKRHAKVPESQRTSPGRTVRAATTTQARRHRAELPQCFLAFLGFTRIYTVCPFGLSALFSFAVRSSKSSKELRKEVSFLCP